MARVIINSLERIIYVSQVDISALTYDTHV